MNKVILISIVLFFPLVSSAGFFVDPHGGLRLLGSTKIAGQDFGHKQLEFGSKIGWHSSNTQLGLDVNLLYPTYKSTIGETTVESYSGFQYGFFLGGRYDLFRGWINWVIATTQTSDINNDVYKGSGWELGVGFGPQNFINIFIKLQMLQFKTQEDSTGVITDLSGGQELETRALIIGFDIPFNFGSKK